jgi:polysaccharide biosynthesis protein VpsM
MLQAQFRHYVQMKLTSGAWLLTLLLAVAGVERAFAENGVAAGGQIDPASRSSMAASLAAQVSEIANSPMISRTKKEKRISTVVRVAVVAATAYKQDAGEILGIALELSAAAAKAAPSFADPIAKAVSFVPAVAQIDGATGQIRSAVFAAAKEPKQRRMVASSAGAHPGIPPQSQAPTTKESPQQQEVIAQAGANPEPPLQPPPPVEVPAAQSEAVRPPSAAETVEATATENPANPEIPSPSASSAAPDLSQRHDVDFYLTAQVGARYDDNVFETKTGKVGDTILTAAPGAEMQYGKNSIGHGTITYSEAFVRYARKSAGDATLGNGNADFNYNDDSLTAAAAASLQQLYQTNIDTLTLGRKELTRSDIFGINGSVESQLGVKTSGKVGADFTRTDYKTPGLVGGDYSDLPLKLYFKATPKVDLSAGYTYGIEKPQGNGPSSRDAYYNVGARGSFTPKLTGEFSVGYRTRDVQKSPQETLLGFDGTLNYELTSKTTSALAFSRQFTASALGESQKNTRYSFSLSTDTTPLWQIGARLAYQDVDYGAAVFTVADQPAALHRVDGNFETSVFTSYDYSSWLTATANYTFRNNHSTLPGVDFSDNILSLMLVFRY